MNDPGYPGPYPGMYGYPATPAPPKKSPWLAVFVGIAAIALVAAVAGIWVLIGGRAENVGTASTDAAAGPATITERRTVTETAAPAPGNRVEPAAADGGASDAAYPEDFGTGRTDVDSRGWMTPGARCHAGDRAFGIIETRDGVRAAACQAPGGYRYYRGHDPNVGSLETEIMSTSERDIVARNGAVHYQMSFSGLLITENNVVIADTPATTWGRVDLG